MVLKYPESHSRKTSSFRCSLFLGGSSDLGRQVVTDPLVLLWEQGPANNPAMLMAIGSEIVMWSSPGCLAQFRKSCSFPPGKRVF